MFEDFVDGGVLTLSAEATSIWEEVNDRNTEYLNTSLGKDGGHKSDSFQKRPNTAAVGSCIGGTFYTY